LRDKVLSLRDSRFLGVLDVSGIQVTRRTAVIRLNMINTKTITSILAAIFDLVLNTPVRAADNPALMQPMKSVYDDYLKVQSALADDSLRGVNEHASAIAKAVRGDGMQMLPVEVAQQADALAKAKDLKAARQAFKPLSASLVKYLADNKVQRGTYHEAYCPMVKATWLQAEKGIKNPYMGKSMLTCGELKD
jgi:hypothetical protein